MIPPIKGGKSLEERIKEAEEQAKKPSIENSSKHNQADDISEQSGIEKLKKPIVARSSVLEKLHQSLTLYKRVGFDMDAEIDEAIESLVNNDLKDITTKKEILNEVIAIGWPIWKKRFQESRKK